MFEHYSVLNRETIEGLAVKPEGTYVDCTLGGGGHSEVILKQLSDKGKLYAFDQDKQAIEATAARLAEYGDRIEYIQANFRDLKSELEERGVTEVDGVVFDLGVSSPQLDQAERGFSYQHDAPLDMRMNQHQALSAYEVVNTWSYEQLVRIFFQYGEENFSKQVARKIEKRREMKPIETTFELVEVIKEAIPAPARRKGGHPAKRIFQAIRIAVNDELQAFRDALQQTAEIVAVGGRVSVITFHSLEDRMCKQAFKSWSTPLPVPRNIPILPEDSKAPFALITRKPILASEEELEDNRRSRSAKLRVAEKIKPWSPKFEF
ncbi:16S rRNA (cytosine(1402)-N(4))-methyltransferase RsmH [Terribacillus saccharophilus]|uniref:Ribosomal RNA small subunit methyltransferase H n=1 Tax=Terribacillus saccharophilus TaxID=361277 RepID=A0A1H8B2A4_9BACI|nr:MULTISPECIES: 16S rRNA (cytosine(1402)-N(4))-methyltransferase RsmH [Terribacillus]AIF66278.1 16S rRNA methyltransferase [Terribacillus goriensis]MCM3225025.1 16S rRNA (cytosine(1402)-N(4))-methyltransferase RsmH [Terribacillus saccharophilus]MEC0301420.1 16S rRNA (cytosine(1402)-N(4))-methyltransferase RsmH [Terribacillus saccharophilus]PAD20993.1 16S rRNA (cytosine(1402)-N(4))-methyltransferase RsmH [Terribacillus saccharophilus]PAF16728.1 16S rRNA (cytosine(1402)-N(4))-methyltransferase 